MYTHWALKGVDGETVAGPSVRIDSMYTGLALKGIDGESVVKPSIPMDSMWVSGLVSDSMADSRNRFWDPRNSFWDPPSNPFLGYMKRFLANSLR
ncbi:hypothetical protein CASFOL_040176 [Castilleja foliolosa]|uniref:Uncharacterized protein n=1 Tax=Castilleja foliolosa TaxID=1961234 RepID=A0ABD3BEY2_9LAMI